MDRLVKTGAVVGALIGSMGLAHAECDIESGSVRILSNDFAALHVVADRAEECAGGGVTVTKNQTAEHKSIQVPALTTNPATYTVAVVANNSIVPLLNDGLLRPMDELVEKYGQSLQDSQLIRIGGKVMAVAFMANAQHLWYRQDVLDEAGLEVPTTYEEVLSNAEVLREKGIMQNPIAANLKPGWDLAAEFVNMYAGFDGKLFASGSAELAIENEQGVKALEMLKALSAYMDRDFVTWDTNAVGPMWESGELSMYNGWGSRAGEVVVEGGKATPTVRETTEFASAPTVGGGSTPAAMLWWDGFTLAKNISDEDAEASFRAMVHALSPELLEEHAEVAAWLIEGYEPTAAAVGVFETVQAGAKPYPMVSHMGLLHTALGDNLAEYMQGQESAEQALKDVTRVYTTAARENGFLR